MREEIGDLPLMADANQVWDVDEAIARMRHLAPFGLRWIEEPTSPDDVLGHAAIRRAVAPVGVATGEHAANRVVFKQLMQAEAIDYCQIDACRLGGVNEVLAVLLLAAKFDVPVCAHAGGLGLCEYVQHLSRDRLRVRERFARRPHHRVCRPPARALRAPGRRPRRALRAPVRCGLFGRSAPRLVRRARVPRRYGVAEVRRLATVGRRGRSASVGRRSRRSGSGVRRSATCSPGVSDDDAARDGRRGLERRHPLLRHRPALRARRVGAPARPRAARPAARRIRVVDEGRARVATGQLATIGDHLHRRR